MSQETQTLEQIDQEYGVKCAQLGQCIVLGEENDKSIFSLKERLHKLLLRSKKIRAAQEAKQEDVVPAENPAPVPTPSPTLPTVNPAHHEPLELVPNEVANG